MQLFNGIVGRLIWQMLYSWERYCFGNQRSAVHTRQILKHCFLEAQIFNIKLRYSNLFFAFSFKVFLLTMPFSQWNIFSYYEAFIFLSLTRLNWDLLYNLLWTKVRRYCELNLVRKFQLLFSYYLIYYHQRLIFGQSV